MNIVAQSNPAVFNQSPQFQCLPVVVVVRPGLSPVKKLLLPIHKNNVIHIIGQCPANSVVLV